MTKAELTNTISEKTGIHKREEQTGDITETPNVMRKEHEIAECIKWGWVYHHTGIPTTEKKEGTILPLFKQVQCCSWLRPSSLTNVELAWYCTVD